jgi:hypothetical protein
MKRGQIKPNAVMCVACKTRPAKARCTHCAACFRADLVVSSSRKIRAWKLERRGYK